MPLPAGSTHGSAVNLLKNRQQCVFHLRLKYTPVAMAKGGSVKGGGGPAGAQEATFSRKHANLGEVVLMMARSDGHRLMHMRDLRWRVWPAVRSGQCVLAKGGPEGGGRTVGYVSWAMMDEKSLERLRSGAPQLRPGDWRSGGQAVVMDAFGSVPQMALMRMLKKSVFADKSLLYWVRKRDGTVETHEVEEDGGVEKVEDTEDDDGGE